MLPESELLALKKLTPDEFSACFGGVPSSDGSGKLPSPKRKVASKSSPEKEGGTLNISTEKDRGTPKSSPKRDGGTPNISLEKNEGTSHFSPEKDDESIEYSCGISSEKNRLEPQTLDQQITPPQFVEPHIYWENIANSSHEQKMFPLLYV
ncbi:hypothetical protein GEMRC1_009752 [Eukaryota sp. GEM-RC1]